MKKTTFLTVALTLLFVIAAVFLLVFSFHRLKTSDEAYTLVNPLNPLETTEALSQEDLAAIQERTGYRKAWSYHEQKVFVMEDLNGTYHYYTLGQSKKQPDFKGAEEMARLAHDIFAKSYPEEDWGGEYVLFLAPVGSIPYLDGAVSEDELSYVWYVVKGKGDFMYTKLTTLTSTPLSAPTAMINSVTGKVIAVTCPKKDWLYSMGYNTPWMSLHDFLYFTNDATWIRIGSRYIQERLLEGEKTEVRADPDTEVSFGLDGTAQVVFLVGKGKNISKIRIMIDLYTNECVGYILYDSKKGGD